MTNQIPKPGTVWQHRDGNLYRVEDVRNTSIDDEAYPIMVCYRPVKDTDNLGKLALPFSRWSDGMKQL